MNQSTRSRCLTAVLLALSGTSHALPIGFGYNQGSLEFMELKSENFTVYHDKRAPADARLALTSLEAAKPHLERWLAVKRKSPLIVNMSAASDNASFANFITDSIELQTLGQGGRDLAWHEYTHSMMYQHLDNWFGPAGAILHLPWMEAWFLEGFAESLSVSIGSDEQAGVERYQALANEWPSWDRIHSLYTSGPFNYRGYATSGAFVSWLLRMNDAEKIPDMLRRFRSKSMPWYWPWAFTPFNGFWPMDDSLRSLSGKSGRELYEQYKIDATAFWRKSATSRFLSKTLKLADVTRNPWIWESRGGKLMKKNPNDDVVGALEATTSDSRAWISDYFPEANSRRYRVGLAGENKKTRWIRRDKATWIDGPWISDEDVWWLETSFETTQLCKASRKSFSQSSVKCSLSTSMPSHLRTLGSREDMAKSETTVLWLARDRETLKGDLHEVIEIQLATGFHRVMNLPTGGRPVSLAVTNDQRWVLTADRSWRHLTKLNEDGTCAGIVEISDFPVRIVNSHQSLPYVVLYTADGYGATSLSTEDFKLKPCRALSSRSSPLLEAMRSKKPLGFKEAMQASDIWMQTPFTAKEESKAPSAKESTTNISSGTDEGSISQLTSKPAKWRGRPVFAFPWIGADDAFGSQIGIISVPLMDEMQNETIRLTALVGAVSRFPYQDITILTNRFAPTWSLSAFRAQTYNGRYRSKLTGNILSGFLEESGAHLDGSYYQYWKRLAVDWTWGVKSSHLKPYIGPTRRVGHLNESYAGVAISARDGGRLYSSSSLRARIAPSIANDVFQYDVVGATATSGIHLGSGRFELGLEGSRTRGPKRRDLQEMYTPLKTLIPGTGAGFNQTNYAFTEDYGLFSPVFGENQARARIMATHPLIKSIDKFSGLVYIDRMDFTGFLNYGTAWRGKDFPDREDMIAAQGYNIDLFMDNKGVNFNMGIGVGQVLSKPWQGYWTFGFDALF